MSDDAVHKAVLAALLASLAGLAAYTVLAVIALTPPEPPLIEPGEASKHVGYVVKVRGLLSAQTECGYPAVVGEGAVLADVKGSPGDHVEVVGVIASTKCKGLDVPLLVPLSKLTQPQQQARQEPTPTAPAGGGNASSVSVP